MMPTFWKPVTTLPSATSWITGVSRGSLKKAAAGYDATNISAASTVACSSMMVQAVS